MGSGMQFHSAATYELESRRATALHMQRYAAQFHRAACDALADDNTAIARVMQRKAAQSHEFMWQALEQLL